MFDRLMVDSCSDLFLLRWLQIITHNGDTVDCAPASGNQKLPVFTVAINHTRFTNVYHLLVSNLEARRVKSHLGLHVPDCPSVVMC